MENLVFTLNAILPILIPIFLGYFLRRINFFDDDFLKKANKLVFKVLIPILLFSNLYAADLSTVDWAFVGYSALAVFILFLIGMVAVTFFVPNKKQKGVIHQAAFRSNYAIIGIPLATMLGGEVAETVASIVAAATVPLFNILAVIALTMYDHEDGERVSIKATLKKMVTNPLILGVAAGLLVVGIRQIVIACGGNAVIDKNSDFFIQTTIRNLSRLATPLALLVLGGQFKFGAVKKLWKQISISTAARLVLVPTAALLVSYAVGFKSSVQFAILIALFGTPIAVSSAPMAGQMGQDEELAGQLVVWTSALSAISLFVIIFICKAVHIF